MPEPWDTVGRRRDLDTTTASEDRPGGRSMRDGAQAGERVSVDRRRPHRTPDGRHQQYGPPGSSNYETQITRLPSDSTSEVRDFVIHLGQHVPPLPSFRLRDLLDDVDGDRELLVDRGEFGGNVLLDLFGIPARLGNY